jgi:hypothetical protein
METLMPLGYDFEVEITKFFRNLPGGEKSYRVDQSGRTSKATITGHPDEIKQGDSVAEIEFLPKKFLAECKHYQSSRVKDKTFVVRKEWLDKARTEAEENGALCLVPIKYKNMRQNATHFIIPQDHFEELLLYIFELWNLRFLEPLGETVNEITKHMDTKEFKALVYNGLFGEKTEDSISGRCQETISDKGFPGPG